MKEKKIMNRFQIAQWIALGAMALAIISWVLAVLTGWEIFLTLFVVGSFGGIVSYFFAGFGTALKMAFSIAQWGWFVVPFPYDLVTFFLAFFLSIAVFLWMPIIPVRKAYKEYQKRMNVEANVE